jgi:glycosyltransferase involved in cell wall biosynthesis
MYFSTGMPNRVLFISYYYPPDVAVGGRRIANFVKHLDPSYEGFVLASPPPAANAASTASQEKRVYRVLPRKTLLDHYRNLKRDHAGRTTMHAGPALNRPSSNFSIKRDVLALLCDPDDQHGWIRPAVRAAKNLVREHRIDAIVSSGPPFSVHEVAARVTAELQKPWIIDFRDAFATDAWRRFAYDGLGFPAWRDRKDWHKEDRWLHTADCIIGTTEELITQLSEAHPSVPRSKFSVVSNGFDPSPLVPMLQKSNGSTRLFVHLGSLYGERRLKQFCRAAQTLLKSRPNSAKFVFIGDNDVDIQEEAASLTPDLLADRSIEFLPPVSWKAAQDWLHRADCLLLLQGEHPTAIPAKFFEYLQSGKPMLALAGQGALSNIVKESGVGDCVPIDDQRAIETALERLITSGGFVDEDKRQQALQTYDARNITKRLAALLDEIVAPSEVAK